MLSQTQERIWASGSEATALPDFFIIGAPKCGTTTLYDWLAEHEQVFMPGKELCFFSQDIYPTGQLVGHIPDLAAYSALFAVPDADGRVKGDATPKYLHSDQALSEIRRLNRRPRLIVCLRDPVDLAISLHSQKVGEGWDRTADFAKAWARELNAPSPEAARRRPSELNYVYWAHLGARLERLFALFDRQDVLVLHLREFRDAPRDVYTRVLSFLGLPDDGRELLRASNPRVGFVSPVANRWALRIARFAEPVVRPLRRLRRGRGFGALRAINRINYIENAYVSEVPESLRKDIYAFLARDIELAERYLDGRPLTNRPERG